MFNNKKIFLATTLLAVAGTANAGYTFKISDTDSLTFGGYIKLDTRYVSGDVAYRDYWIGTGTKLDEKKSQFKMNANETRFNTKYVHGDVTGFIELDFLGGGGNENISNSSNPRLRHAYIKYNDLLAGQTWSTFMNTSALGETADFAGATVGIVFIRQAQIRYSMGNFQVSIENPESAGGDPTKDSMPDIVTRYNLKGNWGNISVSGLARSLTDSTGNSESAFGVSIAGKIKTVGKDDFKFQVHKGELGRYVGIAFSSDFVGNEVEDTTAYLVNYRHFWSENLRSTIQYGQAKSHITDKDHRQWSVNLFTNLTKQLAVGVEVGNFSLREGDANSDYAQLSFKYGL